MNILMRKIPALYMLALLLVLAASGCGTAGHVGYGMAAEDSYGTLASGPVVTDHARGDAQPEAATVATSSRGRAAQSRAPSAGSRPPAAARAVAMEESVSSQGAGEGQRSDALPGALLIYRGTVAIAVFDVANIMEQAIARMESFGGYAQSRSRDMVVFRVPAERFREAFEALRGMGDVVNAEWQADDVGEEYRDVQIRLQRAEATLERLVALLGDAESVGDVLAIEAQMERVTLEIERMRGRLRYLADQVSLSTLTLRLSARATSTPPSAGALPFPWLRQLGLPHLLRL